MEKKAESKTTDRDVDNSKPCENTFDICVHKRDIISEKIDKISVQLEAIGMALVKIGKALETHNQKY